MKFRFLSLTVALLFSLACVQAPVQAAMVSTQSLAGAEQRQAISETLLREDVRHELVRMGVDPADVEARIAALSPGELNRIQGQLDKLPAGGSALGTVALLLLILMLLDIAGVTDIFPGL